MDNNALDEMSEMLTQSDFLALTASLEAARSGEPGREFAQVAQQFRDLALESNYAAKLDQQKSVAFDKHVDVEITNILNMAEKIRQNCEAATSAARVDAVGQQVSAYNGEVISGLRQLAGQIDDQYNEIHAAIADDSNCIVMLKTQYQKLLVSKAKNSR